jgi:protein TonB
MATVRPQADTAPVVDRQVTSKSLAPSQSPRPKARPETLARNATPKPTPKPKATQTIAPRAAQKAAGNGGSTASRTTAQTSKPSTGPSAAALQSAQAAWGAKIRQRVARAQRYPNGTRATGVALMQITVTRGGNVSAVRLVRSSGDAALDAAAVQAIRRARLPAAPKKLAKSSYSFNLPLRFARK